MNSAGFWVLGNRLGTEYFRVLEYHPSIGRVLKEYADDRDSSRIFHIFNLDPRHCYESDLGDSFHSPNNSTKIKTS